MSDVTLFDSIKPNMDNRRFVDYFINELYYKNTKAIQQLYYLYNYLLQQCRNSAESDLACRAFENFIRNEISPNTHIERIEQYVKCITHDLPYEHLLDLDKSIGHNLNTTQIIELRRFMEDTLVIDTNTGERSWVDKHITIHVIKDNNREIPKINRLSTYNTSEENTLFINVMINIIKYGWTSNLIYEFRRFFKNTGERNLTALETIKLFNYIQLNKLDAQDCFLVIAALLNVFNIVIKTHNNKGEKVTAGDIDTVIEIFENTGELKESIEKLQNENLSNADRTVIVLDLFNFSSSENNVIEKIKYIK